MRLLLVRHGESICGVRGIVGGARGCTGLTERGFEQARALRDRLAAEALRADVLLASTLPRAQETAETLAEALGLQVRTEPDLVEMVPGDADGGTWDEWREAHGFDVAGEPDRPLSPNGESVNAFMGRIRRVLDGLAAAHEGQTVVACCHGGIIFYSLTVLMGADPRAAAADADFTSITEWRREDGRWSLVRFNDTAHLHDTDLLVRSLSA